MADPFARLQPGDVILFGGTSAFAYLIRCVVGCAGGRASFCRGDPGGVRRFNHAAIVYSVDGGSVRICHASSAHTGRDPTVRVLVEELADVLRTPYYLDAAAFVVAPPDVRERLRLTPERIREACDEYVGVLYETDFCECVRAPCDYGTCCANRESREKLFCTELVAAVLKDLGVITGPTAQPANEYVMEDFAALSEMRFSLPVPPQTTAQRAANFFNCR